MLVSFQGHKYGRQKSTETSFFELAEGRGGGGGGGYLSVNSSIEELIKTEVILILFQDKEYLDSKISKNPHKSLPGRQLNATSCKRPGNSSVSCCKRRTL